MSPGVGMNELAASGFPRVSGDEPESGRVFHGQIGFSPRERG